MNNREMILAEFQKSPKNTIFMTGKLYREKFSFKISEVAYSQIISRLYKNGEIERISQGVYCCPKITRFGKVLPSEQEIVETFTAGTNGVVVGYVLYNSFGITTQIPKNQIIYSCLADEKLKKIGNVTIKKYDIEYSDDVKSIIQLMELLYHYKDIQDINIVAWINGVKKLSAKYNDSTFEIVQKTINYPKWTIAFLQEILNYYHIPNNLNRYLSSLSEYSFPKMEELYEIA